MYGGHGCGTVVIVDFRFRWGRHADFSFWQFVCKVWTEGCIDLCAWLRREESLKNTVFLDITQCGSCKNRRFGGTYLLNHHHPLTVFLRSVLRSLVTADVSSSPILFTLMMEAILRFLQEPQGVTSKTTVFVIVTTVKTTNHTEESLHIVTYRGVAWLIKRRFRIGYWIYSPIAEGWLLTRYRGKANPQRAWVRACVWLLRNTSQYY
jgi:hypothetical protein